MFKGKRKKETLAKNRKKYNVRISKRKEKICLQNKCFCIN